MCSANLGSIHIRHVDIPSIPEDSSVYTEEGVVIMQRNQSFRVGCARVEEERPRNRGIVATKVITSRTVSRLARTRTKVDKQANFMTRLELVISDKGRTTCIPIHSETLLRLCVFNVALSTRPLCRCRRCLNGDPVTVVRPH